MPNDFDMAAHFFHDVPEEVAAIGLQGGKEQSDRPLGDPWPLQAWLDVPTRVIVGQEDRFFPPEFQERVARDRLDSDESGAAPHLFSRRRVPSGTRTIGT